MKFEEWVDTVKRGTSGDQVMDIIKDWKKERALLQQEVNFLKACIKMALKMK
jgi:hypothetical protein